MNKLRQYYFHNTSTITYNITSSISANSFEQRDGQITTYFKLYEVVDGKSTVMKPENLQLVKVSGPNVVFGNINSDGSGGYMATIRSDYDGTLVFKWKCSKGESIEHTVTILFKPLIIDTGECVLGWSSGNGSGFAWAGPNNFGWKPPKNNLGKMENVFVHDKQLYTFGICVAPSGYSRRGQVDLQLKNSDKWPTNKIRVSFPDIPSGKTGWVLDWMAALNGDRYAFRGDRGATEAFVDFIRLNNNKAWKIKIDLL